MSPAHTEPRRWLVLALVAAVLAGLAVIARASHPTPTGGLPARPVAFVPATSAESSDWYCVGESTAGGQIAIGSVDLTNTGGHPVSGSITSVTDTGVTVATPITVPAGRQIAIGAPASNGSWMAQTVELSGGGVAVSQSVHGPSGWSEAPCQSGTSQQWYFPSGSTAGSNMLYMALFNPTSTPDVVDLTFVTPGGVYHPISYQGLVLAPQQTMVENVGTYIQNQSIVSSTVTTRTGRVVASETQVFGGNAAGLATLPGSPRPARQWSIPQAEEVQGGTSSIDIYNPGPDTESVTVRSRLVSGPLPPFSEKVLPDSTWRLATSDQTRIPKVSGGNGAYATQIVATGGPGVVVGRAVAAPTPPSPATAMAGLSAAVDELTTTAPALQWVVPGPGTSATPAVAGAAPDQVALTNPLAVTETYRVYALLPGSRILLTQGRLPPSTFISLSGKALARAGRHPLLVTASDAVAVSENVAPTGAYGVVTMPGIPLASTAGS